jgi:CheY-like chemotaxis protein
LRAFPLQGHFVVTSPPLAGCRVLVVEDEELVSLVIEEVLADQQSVVIGPFARLQPALEAAQSAEIDIALLDASLHGDAVYPVAEALSARRIPFLLLSGYGAGAVPFDRPEWRFCSKPFSQDVLIRLMLEQLTGSRRN